MENDGTETKTVKREMGAKFFSRAHENPLNNDRMRKNVYYVNLENIKHTERQVPVASRLIQLMTIVLLIIRKNIYKMPSMRNGIS